MRARTDTLKNNLFDTVPVPAPMMEIRKASIPVSRRRRVIVLDRDSTIRYGIGRMLEVAGYDSFIAEKGDDVIECCKKAKDRGHKFDIAILDLAALGSTGNKDIDERLLQVDPTVSIIISCSDITDPRLRSFTAKYEYRFILQKPFTLYELNQILQRVCA